MEPDDELVVAGRYRLIALAGFGGMGRVWRAHDDLLDREVAVKEVLAPDDLPDPARAKIQRDTVREARAAARLDHPHVVGIFDVIQASGRSWIVMEYVPSRSLHDIVISDGPLPHRNAARIAASLLDALDAAHRAGVLHLDVKPQNVLIAEDGRVVLTDFGLATMITAPAGHDEPLMGSPFYIAPERVRDGASSRQADLWSLGATLYMAVEGRPPYDRPDAAEAITALLTEAPDPPQHPGPLHTVIAGLLTTDPERRLTADDARLALRNLNRRAVGVHAVPVSPRPAGKAVRYRSTAATPRWRGLLVAGIAAAIATIGATAGVRAYGSESVPAAVVTPVSASPTPPSVTLTDAVRDDEAPVSLPEGWLWHVDTAGFALPVPRGWQRGTTPDGVCFGDTNGVRSFTVEPGGPLDGRPLRRWQDAEQKPPPGYQKISMGPLLITGGGADWEYSWQPATGPRMHTYRMLLAAGDDRSYALTWTSRDADWSLDLPVQRILVNGFRDSAEPAVTWTIPGP
ncbi:serine/threonine-protein kinase [Actinoplanes couchii]|uniref:non-specific serine/threonine protein kinase n=1 Tax=Actinoplanes couchii TaxID=403638 RepID=A0ABQ3XU13_9ACTN|nr:serine/threonine-protein kinase [Actinoplanes couchii]MDR6318692.1 hypothetical protein [Actinoplanes couchii]GID62008.1 hypothetical protein Aco03nite_104120 [Actinoplanes couchii]